MKQAARCRVQETIYSHKHLRLQSARHGLVAAWTVGLSGQGLELTPVLTSRTFSCFSDNVQLFVSGVRKKLRSIVPCCWSLVAVRAANLLQEGNLSVILVSVSNDESVIFAHVMTRVGTLGRVLECS